MQVKDKTNYNSHSLQGLRSATLSRDSDASVFCEFCEIFRTFFRAPLMAPSVFSGCKVIMNNKHKI